MPIALKHFIFCCKVIQEFRPVSMGAALCMQILKAASFKNETKPKMDPGFALILIQKKGRGN